MDYYKGEYVGQLMSPLPPKPRPKRARTPHNKGQSKEAVYVSRTYPSRAPISVQQQPRDRWGRWVDMALHPRVTGPRRLTPVKSRVRKSKSGMRVPWGQRGKLGKFIGLFTGAWAKWRRAELKKRAKQNRKRYGIGG